MDQWRHGFMGGYLKYSKPRFMPEIERIDCPIRCIHYLQLKFPLKLNYWQIDGDGLLALGVDYFIDQFKNEYSEDDTLIIKSRLETGLEPLEAQLSKQRNAAESAEKIIDRQFDVITLPSLTDPMKVIVAYHQLSR